MSLDAKQLFALLPAVYRTRDAENGGPLRALFAVIAAQSGIVQDNIEQLYDDQFIETCAPWVIPYIGDLVGYNSIYEVVSASFDSRAEVANTIGYRRRKGTLIALEQLSMDVSGRAAVAVEEFKRLITTESMRFVRPHHVSTVNLRNIRALDRYNTAFDTENRTIDVRRIAPRLRTPMNPDPAPLDIALHGPGRFNIPDIAIHLWRSTSRPIINAPAFVVGGGRYMFSPLGQDMPLFSQPPIRGSFSGLTTRIDVPEPIDRYEFSQSLKACNNPTSTAPMFYGHSILLIADGVPVDCSQIVCANLSDRTGRAWCKVASGKIAIDPELGRIQYAADLTPPKSLRVNYSYGFPAEIAGGPYDRSASLSPAGPAQANLFAIVGSAGFPTLESAVTAWNKLAPGAIGIIVLPNFERFTIDLTAANTIQLPAGSNLSIVSGEPVTAGGPQDVIWNNSCVTLTGNIQVNGLPGAPLPEGKTATAGQLLISGVWIAGQLSITGQSATVQISDSTLVPGISLTRDVKPVSPGDPSILVTAAEAALTLIRAISGPIAADIGGTTRICSSIVDATSPCCVAYTAPDLASAGADLHVEDSTIIGKVHTRTITLASNTIFFARLPRRDPWPAAVRSSRRQTGCVRFCFLPFDSITPQRYRCLPPDAASQPALEPKFVTLRYGKPAYALLSGDVPMAIWQGADNGSQPGVYYQIQETEAIRNVRLRAPEFLPVCMESGIFLHPSRPLLEPRPVFLYGSRPARDYCDDPDAAPQSFSGIGSELI
jgi:hypothetical protein